MSAVATVGIGYNLAYPWSAFDYERDHWLVTVTQGPTDESFLSSPEGPDIYIKGYGRVCYRFDDGGEIYYCPWIPVTVSPQLIPMPEVRQNRTVELIQVREPGVIWAVTTARTR